MARPEAQSVGLYYPTPTHLLPAIASLVKVGTGKSYSVVDPCAADGEAVIGITKCIFDLHRIKDPSFSNDVTIYASELEETRAERPKSRQWSSGYRMQPVHGDALRLAWSFEETYGDCRNGASLFFGNPPYDNDREHTRLEERWLRRFAPCLADQGTLVWLVPFYSLSASADTLAREFTGLRCYRFPDEDFPIFKQIVLIGTKRPTLAEPDPAIRAQVIAWSESTDSMSILGSERHVVEMPGHEQGKSGFSKWSVVPLDIQGLTARLKPWHSSDRAGRLAPVTSVVPAPGDLLARRYPLAVPPKPAHLAAAIASGVFNGAKVSADETASKLPPLYVKGVFDKEFVKTEEKTNKDGEKTGEVRVQQPKLVVTVLDTSTGTYHTLTSKAERTAAKSPAEMTTGDLLGYYGKGLMDRMFAQCPVMHDPATDTERFPMPTFERSLYRAQEEAVRALVKLLGGVESRTPLPKRGKARIKALRSRGRSQRRGRAAYLLGEIGSGKSFCSLATAHIIGARRVLVMAPPHLMQGWTDQVRQSIPWAQVTVLGSVDAVDEFCTSTDPGMRVAVLSRESAKLSHAYDGVRPLGDKLGSVCPACGAPLPVSNDGITMTPAELAKKRTRCVARTYEPVTPIARAAREIATVMMLVWPRAPEVNQLVRGRMRDKMMLAAARRLKEEKYSTSRWPAAQQQFVRHLDALALEMLGSHRERAEAIGGILLRLLGAVNDDAVTADLCERLYLATCFDPESYGTGADMRTWVRDALLLMHSPRGVAERLKALNLHTSTYYAGGMQASPWGAWEMRAEAIAKGEKDPEDYRSGFGAGRTLHKHTLGSPALVVEALGKLYLLGGRRESEPCGEPLYQAIPEPRRVALASYLAKRYPNVIDLLIGDEAHEFAGDGSAQGFAFARLSGLGMPVLALTGSVMNGYAESLFNNQWALDPAFREEFSREQRRQFVKRYGYLKVLVQHQDKDNKVIAWGSQSDRRETQKEIGNAPGVLPLFVLRYLLRIAVTLHKSDLALDLPKHIESASYVEPEAEMLSRYTKLLDALKKQIKQDRFDPLRSGKLFGALSELPSYLDRATADCGNREDGSYEVAYPVSDELEEWSGRVIARFDGLPESTVLPKEKWLLNYIEAALTKGERVMLFAWHESVLPRLQKLVEREMKESCALLLAGKVQAAKRQTWIDEKVIKPKRRVLAVNGAAVQTGLNNLVWFSRAVWMQNPGVNPIVYRQANGRIDRIGKKMMTEAAFPIYDGTAQALAHKLLMHKVAVSMATDGLDAEGALAAAGVGGSDTIDAMSVGRALFEMMERGESMRAERAPRPTELRGVEAPVVVPAPVPPANDAGPVTRTASGKKEKPKQLDLFGLFEKAS